MRVHYLVAAHARPPAFHELVDALLLDKTALVHVHIDAKVDEAPFGHVSNRVFFVPATRRVAVRWAHWTQVLSTLALLEQALACMATDDRVVLLSGDSYPLAHPSAIRDHFARKPTAQYVNMVRMPSLSAGKPISRVSAVRLWYDPRDGGKHVLERLINRLNLPRPYRRALGGKELWGGSTWWSLTHGVAEMCLREAVADRAFVRLCEVSAMPDEFFFQTLVGVVQGGLDIQRGPMYADFKPVSGPPPGRIDRGHLQRLMDDRLMIDDGIYPDGIVLFARKFDSTEAWVQARELWKASESFLYM